MKHIQLIKPAFRAARVLLFGDKVLKIFNQRREADREYSMLCWLQGKLPVPKVLDYRHQLENSFLLMTKAPGVMSCSPDYLTKQELLAELLAKGAAPAVAGGHAGLPLQGWLRPSAGGRRPQREAGAD